MDGRAVSCVLTRVWRAHTGHALYLWSPLWRHPVSHQHHLFLFLWLPDFPSSYLLKQSKTQMPFLHLVSPSCPDHHLPFPTTCSICLHDLHLTSPFKSHPDPLVCSTGHFANFISFDDFVALMLACPSQRPFREHQRVGWHLEKNEMLEVCAWWPF